MPKLSSDPASLAMFMRENAPIENSNTAAAVGRIKRKAENSPAKTLNSKRAALGNLTNTTTIYSENLNNNYSKLKLEQNAASISIRPQKLTTNIAEDSDIQKIKKSGENDITLKESEFNSHRISNEFSVNEDSLSLYTTASDDFPATSDTTHCSDDYSEENDISVPPQNNQLKTKTEKKKIVNVIKEEDNRILTPSPLKNVPTLVPDGVIDFDKLNWNDPFQVSHYAMDIFNYLKSREKLFQIDDYIERQFPITKWMRSLLVDWMVEVQETFELNHETLYLAVKIVDLFLSKAVLDKDRLQLLGAAALFISCKFDERTPPLIDDFLYICDGAYNQTDLIQMEIITLKTIDFDLGIPLSYRFLRRYARCAKVPMPTLTLARYILELSLMDYATIRFSDSKLAAAALFMALRMYGDKIAWTKTLEYFTGYKLNEFSNIICVLNSGLKRKPKEALKTIRSKYSHTIFHEAAKVKVLSIDELFAFNK